MSIMLSECCKVRIGAISGSMRWERVVSIGSWPLMYQSPKVTIFTLATSYYEDRAVIALIAS
jgi:hypothetical protein